MRSDSFCPRASTTLALQQATDDSNVENDTLMVFVSWGPVNYLCYKDIHKGEQNTNLNAWYHSLKEREGL